MGILKVIEGGISAEDLDIDVGFKDPRSLVSNIKGLKSDFSQRKGESTDLFRLRKVRITYWKIKLRITLILLTLAIWLSPIVIVTTTPLLAQLDMPFDIISKIIITFVFGMVGVLYIMGILVISKLVLWLVYELSYKRNQPEVSVENLRVCLNELKEVLEGWDYSAKDNKRVEQEIKLGTAVEAINYIAKELAKEWRNESPKVSVSKTLEFKLLEYLAKDLISELIVIEEYSKYGNKKIIQHLSNLEKKLDFGQNLIETQKPFEEISVDYDKAYDKILPELLPEDWEIEKQHRKWILGIAIGAILVILSMYLANLENTQKEAMYFAGLILALHSVDNLFSFGFFSIFEKYVLRGKVGESKKEDHLRSALDNS